MQFFAKYIILSFLFVAAYADFIEHETNTSNITKEHETNTSNITEDQLENECDDCDWRYFKHYEVKDCILEQVNSCGCPKKYSCPQNQTLEFPEKVCVYRNKEYSVGSKIVTSNTCQVCRCHDGEPPYVSCIHKDCPQVEFASGSNCHLLYKENRPCCPVTHACFTNESEDEIEIASNKTCEYNGEFYPFGSRIYPVDDPCQICICDETWKGVDNSSCYQQDCVLEQKKSKLDAGCIPVYHESRCCPIEFYCPSTHKFSYSLLSSNESEINETSEGDKCSFGEKFYDVGDQLFLDNPCVTCHCLVPPDFTCIHQTCPRSPNDVNCYPLRSKEECCPSYECLYGDAVSESVPAGCPTPLCADSSCHIGTLAGHECPTCVCSESASELEHNEVEQQVQQISQGVEENNQVYEGPGETSDYDYSEDQLQLMPIRIQDAEGDFSIMERIILPESDKQDPEEGFREIDDSSSENNSSAETVPTGSEEVLNEQNPESELEDSFPESNSNESEKEVQKRSNGGEVGMPLQQEKIFAQFPDDSEGIEREGENTESNGDFNDELERFRNKIFEKNGTIINEIISINHEVEVPAGCPTPMCEGSWCKVGILPGHKCPTCICKRHVENEP